MELAANKRFIRSKSNGVWHKPHSQVEGSETIQTVCGQSVTDPLFGLLFDNNLPGSVRDENEPDQTQCIICFGTTLTDWPEGEEKAKAVLQRLQEYEGNF